MVPNRPTREASPHRRRAEGLAALLRAKRVEMRLSQQELARRAQISIATLRAIEGGRTVEPGFFTVVELAKALGIGLENALDRVDQRVRADEDDTG